MFVGHILVLDAYVATFEVECLVMKKGELIDRPPEANAASYMPVLEGHILPSVRTVFAAGEIAEFDYVNSNACIHKARIVYDWYHQHLEILEVVANW